MRDCTTCDWSRKVWTLRNGLDNFCLHPRSIEPHDGVAAFTRRAREPGQPCGPAGDLHSANEKRMGYMSPEQWRTTQ